MTVYKYFIKIAFRNKWIILSYTLIFLILAILNGANTSVKNVDFIEAKLRIGIIDNNNTELSKALKEYLTERNNIIDVSNDEEEIKEQIFLEAVDGVIVIPEDFHHRVKNKEEALEIYRDDRKIGSFQIQNQVNKFLAFAEATKENGQYDLGAVKTALKGKALVNVIESRQNSNEGAKIWYNFYFNFTAYIIIAVYIAVLGLVMNDFSSEEIQSRIKISSKKLFQFNKEIYLGQLTVTSLITTIFILGSILLKGKYIGEVFFLKHVVNIIIFSFTILCLTFFINNFTNNRFAKNGLSTILSLGTSFISGVMVPQEFLGEKVLTIAKFFPTYYFVRVNDMSINSIFQAKYELLMQLLFALAFILMGLYSSKVKQRA